MAKDGVYAVVTGASSGIGKEIAILFAQDEVNLVLAAKNGNKLATFAKELKNKYHVDIHLSVGDLSKTGVAEGLFEFCKKKKLDVEYLVNSAGFGEYGKITQTDWNLEKEMIGVNDTALTYLSKMFASTMKERGDGRILNIASTASFVPGPRMAVYHATKHYVLALSQAMNYELKGTGVSVTAFCPGPTNTPFWDRASLKGTKLAKRSSKFPSAKTVAVYGYNSMLHRKPVAMHGLKNRFRTLLYKLMPRGLSVRLAAKRLFG